jgi:hypothetical protein
VLCWRESDWREKARKCSSLPAGGDLDRLHCWRSLIKLLHALPAQAYGRMEGGGGSPRPFLLYSFPQSWQQKTVRSSQLAVRVVRSSQSKSRISQTAALADWAPVGDDASRCPSSPPDRAMERGGGKEKNKS